MATRQVARRPSWMSTLDEKRRHQGLQRRRAVSGRRHRLSRLRLRGDHERCEGDDLGSDHAFTRGTQRRYKVIDRAAPRSSARSRKSGAGTAQDEATARKKGTQASMLLIGGTPTRPPHSAHFVGSSAPRKIFRKRVIPGFPQRGHTNTITSQAHRKLASRQYHMRGTAETQAGEVLAICERVVLEAGSAIRDTGRFTVVVLE